MMLEMQKNHYDSETIAKVMNANNIPTRYGKRWHSGTVSKILARQTPPASL